MPVQLSQNAVLKVLNGMQLNPLWEQGSDQIYILLTIAQREVPIFFGLRGNNTLLQTIAYLPYDLQDPTKGEVARLLHAVNKEIDMPGFGMDEAQKLMFFRSVIPCPNGELNEKLLELYLATTRIACETFMDAIAMTAAGLSSTEQVLQHMKKKKS